MAASQLEQKASEFIVNNSREEGLVRAFAVDKSIGQEEYEDLTTFVTGFTGLHITPVHNPSIEALKKKMIALLLKECVNQKFWMWSATGSDLRKYIPLDIDTSSINSEFLLLNGITLNNVGSLLKNRHPKKEEGFYSWIIPRRSYLKEDWKTIAAIYRHSFYKGQYWAMTPSRPNECNAFMTVNMLHYCILRDKSLLPMAEDFLSQFSSIEEMPDIYYRNDLLNYYLASRLLRFSKREDLRSRFMPRHKNISSLSDLELASLILALKNYQQNIPEAWSKELASRQNQEGGWGVYDVFTYGDKTTWRSPALSTALALLASL